jgi:hypothetical protein
MTHLAAARGGGDGARDRMIDGMDLRGFLLGDAWESGRDTILCMQGNRVGAENLIHVMRPACIH